MHRNKSTSTLLWSHWQAIQSLHKAAPPLSLLQESHDPFQFSSAFTGRGLPADRDFQSKSISSSAPLRLRQEQQRCAAGSVLFSPNPLGCAWSCTPSPEPHSSSSSLTPSSTHPPKPANNPPCTLNPLGQQPGHPILGKEKGKSTGPGRGRTILIRFVCHYLMSTQFRTFFPWGEASAEYELGTLLLWKLLNITSPASEEFIQPPGC